jgi:hypothetical protein
MVVAPCSQDDEMHTRTGNSPGAKHYELAQVGSGGFGERAIRPPCAASQYLGTPEPGFETPEDLVGRLAVAVPEAGKAGTFGPHRAFTKKYEKFVAAVDFAKPRSTPR